MIKRCCQDQNTISSPWSLLSVCAGDMWGIVLLLILMFITSRMLIQKLWEATFDTSTQMVLLWEAWGPQWSSLSGTSQGLHWWLLKQPELLYHDNFHRFNAELPTCPLSHTLCEGKEFPLTRLYIISPVPGCGRHSIDMDGICHVLYLFTYMWPSSPTASQNREECVILAISSLQHNSL